MSAAFMLVHDVGPPWLLAMWLGSARWVHVDARARLGNRSGIRAATLLALLLPGAGVAVWLALRPAQTRLGRRERRAASRLLEPTSARSGRDGAGATAATEPGPPELRRAAA